MMGLQTGLDRVATGEVDTQSWGRCGLVCNQASVSPSLAPAWKVMRERLGDRLVALFGPQHGFESTVQDNMIETGHSRHVASGLPVFSLYSETREPTDEMLAGVDTIIFDMQITGCRVYTYKYTLAGCLRAAARKGLKVVVLDRPNPLGGVTIEGNVLDLAVRSFVGEYSIPMRHGLTPAEVGLLFNQSISADLEIVEMRNWLPDSYWHELGRHWILTSPNLPTFDGVAVYCGGVLFEGTNVSEGRGTAMPFQFYGAPFVRHGQDVVSIISRLYPDLEGVILRPASFQPTSQKWAGQVCNGVHLVITDPKAIRSYELGLALVRAFLELGEGRFSWAQPPYEYEFEKLPIDLVIGHPLAHQRMSASDFSLRDSFWTQGIPGYIASVASILRYPRTMRSASN